MVIFLDFWMVLLVASFNPPEIFSPSNNLILGSEYHQLPITEPVTALDKLYTEASTILNNSKTRSRMAAL